MLFELLPYPMDIVITFLKPSKFYTTSKNQRPVTSTSGKVGGARLRRFMVMSTIEVQKNYAEWRTQIVCRVAPPGRKTNNELQCQFVDDRRVVPDERLLCYPPKRISGRWVLVPFGDTVKQMCCFLPE